MHDKNGSKTIFARFAEDKGFYITLMLCVIAIGISGYVLFFLPEAEQSSELDLDLDPGLPSAADVIPDSRPEIPEVQVQLEPEEISLPEPQEEAPVYVPLVPAAAEPAEEPAEEVWLFDRKPTYRMPVSGEIIRGFSMDALVYDETMGDWRTHNGIDISCGAGDAVMAAADGTVQAVYTDALLGTVIEISHADDLTGIYCGLAAETAVQAGDAVRAGDLIGTAGNTVKTESAMECHIHLTMQRDGEYIDPQSLKLE